MSDSHADPARDDEMLPRERRRTDPEDQFDDFEVVDDEDPDERDSKARSPRRKRKKKRKKTPKVKGQSLSGSKLPIAIAIGLGAVCCVVATILLGVAIVKGSGQAVIGMFALGPFGLALIGLGIYKFVRAKRLVVGPTSLMLVVGQDEVLGNLPYDNIVVFRFSCSVPYADDPVVDQFEILLNSRKRLDTFWTRPWIHDEEVDVRVTDDVTVDLTYLRLLLVKAIRNSGSDVDFV